MRRTPKPMDPCDTQEHHQHPRETSPALSCQMPTWHNAAVQVRHKVIPHACLGLPVWVHLAIFAILPGCIHDSHWNTDLQQPPASDTVFAALRHVLQQQLPISDFHHFQIEGTR